MILTGSLMYMRLPECGCVCMCAAEQSCAGGWDGLAAAANELGECLNVVQVTVAMSICEPCE